MAQAHALANEGPHAHHIIPKSTLIKVFGGLVILTIVTVLTSRIDMGMFNVPLALAIACAKAGLVVTFFMALKYDKRVNMLVFTVGTLFVIVFLVFTVFDVAFRGDLPNVTKQTIMDQRIEEEALRSGQQTPLPAPGGSMRNDAAGGAAVDSAAADTAATGSAADTATAPTGTPRQP